MEDLDKIEERGFIDKESLLQYVSEEEIFKLVFLYEPIEFEYVTSPFREDSTPGCWFEYAPSGELRFIDFANNTVKGNVRLNNIDCFDAVKIHFNIPNFFQVLIFIKQHLLDGKPLIKKEQNKKLLKTDKKSVEILIKTKIFDSRDKTFWKKYEISKQNLIDDKVFGVKTFKMLNTRKGDITTRIYDICYAYTDFDDNKKKLYRPFQKGKRRFFTNCSANDIGEMNKLIPCDDILVISKSYKDCRVLRNQGLNCIWFQNEGMIPSKEILIPLCQSFKTVIIFFDNDRAGIEAAIKVKNIINSILPNKAIVLYLPETLNPIGISDPSDLIFKKGKKELHIFLKKHNLLNEFNSMY